MDTPVRPPVWLRYAALFAFVGALVFCFCIAPLFGFLQDPIAHAQMPANTKNVLRCTELEALSRMHAISLETGFKKLVSTYNKADERVTAFTKETPIDYKKLGRVQFVYLLCVVQSNNTKQFTAAAKKMEADAVAALKSHRQTAKDIPDATIASLEEANTRLKVRIEAVDALVKEAAAIIEHPEKPFPGEE